MKKIYLLKDLARDTRNSVYTLKYYYKLGLIKEYARSPYTNFRFFDYNTVIRVKKIRKLRKKGMSLKEIKKII